MVTDKTTLYDLAILSQQDGQSLYDVINRCRTGGGSQRLLYFFQHPLSELSVIQQVQQTLQLILEVESGWTNRITNGSVLVIEKYYHTPFDDIPGSGSDLSGWMYKLFHGPDFSLVRYTVEHAFDFVRGMQELAQLLDRPHAPALLRKHIDAIRKLTQHNVLGLVQQAPQARELSIGKQMQLGHFFRYHYKLQMQELLDHYFQLDAWFGMAQAMKQYQLRFPEFVTADRPQLCATQLYHLLLPKPVAYDLTLDDQGNFLFLTGANMAGKSTFIRAVGTAVFLAHLGMGVPAASLQLSMFDGLLTNINVTDNLVRGESYFFNEVQRIKRTVQQVTDGRKWLILIDELFKGTNVQDAMKCSLEVIEGLLKVRPSLFILSTHLYEIGEFLQQQPNIRFAYFETGVHNDELSFSYQLKPGISNDRLGYLILRNEGVVKLLQDIPRSDAG